MNSCDRCDAAVLAGRSPGPLPAPLMPRQGPALGSSITEAFKQAFGSTLLPGYERALLLVKRRLLGQRLLAPPGGCGGSDAPTHPIAPGAA